MSKTAHWTKNGREDKQSKIQTARRKREQERRVLARNAQTAIAR